MKCQTCKHEMECLYAGDFSSPAICWCAWCGSRRIVSDIVNECSEMAPALVQRCRDFRDQAVDRKTDRIEECWRRTGIKAIVNPKAEPRPRNFGDLCSSCGCCPCACPPGE